MHCGLGLWRDLRTGTFCKLVQGITRYWVGATLPDLMGLDNSLLSPDEHTEFSKAYHYGSRETPPTMNIHTYSEHPLDSR